MAYFYNTKAEPRRVVCMVLMPEAVSGIEATKHRVRNNIALVVNTEPVGSMSFFCINISIFNI